MARSTSTNSSPKLSPEKALKLLLESKKQVPPLLANPWLTHDDFQIWHTGVLNTLIGFFGQNATQINLFKSHVDYDIGPPLARYNKTELLESSKRAMGNAVKELDHFIRYVQAFIPETTTPIDQYVSSGNRIFIGHGGSDVWKEFRGFLKDRLQLQVDDFNRVSIAGKTNVDRLKEMLDSACFAFLIMTAEDESREGTKHARQNVIHEVGLFQGRLGFSRAIVLLEDGCEEFSNIAGLGQIRFSNKNILAAFDLIRMALEQEGLISGTGTAY